MPNIVVVGTQWGDEGKGKVVDLLAPHVNVVVRYQGGNNAGHTVVVGREKYVLHSIPSGILHPGCRCVIGCGVVVDPGSLIEEMEALVQRGVTLDGNLFISKNAHLIMPYHPALDRASEAKLGARRIGTTGRGVGPAYVDKAARVGIRMADLLDERLFREKLELNLAQKNRLLREIYDAQTLHGRGDPRTRTCATRAGSRRTSPTRRSCCRRWIDSGYRVLFEGAQATMLDIDHGTYPYVTSSSTTAGGASTGTGVPPTQHPRRRSACAKAYTTRVGGGPFPTEMTGAVAEAIRARGNEYGATTGRPRRCGWFDAVVGALRGAHQRPRHRGAHQARRARPVRDAEGLRRATGYRGETLTEFPEDETVRGGGRARLRGDRGLACADHRREERGRSAGEGAALSRAARGADRRRRSASSRPAPQRDETILCEDSPLHALVSVRPLEHRLARDLGHASSWRDGG